MQGKENLVGRAMTEVQSEFATFRNRNAACNEKVAFAVIAGDFNIDNISPGKKRELLSDSSEQCCQIWRFVAIWATFGATF